LGDRADVATDHVLIVGDSTGRWQYGTLCATLKAMRPRDVKLAEARGTHVINFNKGRATARAWVAS
jgi:hypothetical protein